jgi:predicted phosphohydrolase
MVDLTTEDKCCSELCVERLRLDRPFSDALGEFLMVKYTPASDDKKKMLIMELLKECHTLHKASLSILGIPLNSESHSETWMSLNNV